MTTRTRAVAAALLVTLLAAPAPALAAKDYRAEHYDVQLDIEPGGAMVVTERIRFVFGPDTFTYVYRGLRPRRTDGFTIERVAIDGRALSPGDDAWEYEVERRDNGERRVVWHFPATTGQARTFEIVYRVRGVVRFETAEDLLEWHVLPTAHAYAIGCASLRVQAPAGAALLGPADTEPAAERAGNALPLQLTRCGFGKDDTWLLRARFTARSIVPAPQLWQQRDARAQRYMPLFLGLAAMILFAGVGGFIAFGATHRTGVHTDRHVSVDTPPDGLPVPVGAALAASGQVSWPVALSVVFDLAGRHVIAIREVAGSFLQKRDFEMTQGTAPASVRPYERAILDMLFTGKRGPRTSVKFSELASAASSGKRWKAFTRAIEDELLKAGVYDADRRRLRTRVTVTGGIIAVCGLPVLVAAVPFIKDYGGAALTMGVAVALVGIAGLITGTTLSPLTDDGIRRSAAWAAYGRHLKGLPKSPAAVSQAPVFAALLPAAVAFGSALAWAKALEKAGVSAGPAWLQALPEHEHHMGTMVALLSAGNAAGAHSGAGGVAGGGAAGGGTSGAG